MAEAALILAVTFVALLGRAVRLGGPAARCRYANVFLRSADDARRGLDRARRESARRRAVVPMDLLDCRGRLHAPHGRRLGVSQLRRAAACCSLVTIALAGIGIARGLAVPPGGTDYQAVDGEIISDPGDGWIEQPSPEDFVAALQQRMWFRDNEVLFIYSVESDQCEDFGTTGQGLLTALMVGANGLEYTATLDGVARYESRFEPAMSARLFSTQRFAYAALLLAIGPVEDLEGKLDDIAQLQIDAAGGVERFPVRASSELDQLVLRDDPQSRSIRGVEFDSDELTCNAALDTEVGRFLRRHVSQRNVIFNRSGVIAETFEIVIISLTDYPYDDFSALAFSAPAPADQMRPTAIEGLELLRDAKAWGGVVGPERVMIRLRRGRINVEVNALAGTRERAEQLALTFARAQIARLPDGPSTSEDVPSAARSAWDSALLASAVGALTLGARRASGGRRQRRQPGAPRADAVVHDVVNLITVVDLDDLARSLRRLGRAVTTVQLLVVVAMITGFAAELGVWRWIIIAGGLVVGTGATWFGRRREDSILGSRGDRSMPAVAPASAVMFVCSCVILLTGGTVLIFGLREVVFFPSLTHLRLSDRVGAAPNVLSWMLFAVGVGLLVAGAAIYRFSRALARVGWRGAGSEQDPVVYLRSFHDDALRIPTVFSARRPFVEWFNLGGREPFEESVAWELALKGPVIAIGRPGSTRATLGAAREHISDDDWQAVIVDRIDQAYLLAVTIGATDGLAWELGQIVERGHLAKTILIVPPTTVEDLGTRWSFTRQSLAGHGAGLAGPDRLPPGALAIVPKEQGHSLVLVGEIADEASYRAAIAVATRRKEQTTLD
jgi:hypothetical protein